MTQSVIIAKKFTSELIQQTQKELHILKLKKRVVGVIALGAILVSGLALAGLLGSNPLVMVAVMVVAFVTGIYSWFCAQAEKNLQTKLINLQTKKEPPLAIPAAILPTKAEGTNPMHHTAELPDDSTPTD